MKTNQPMKKSFTIIMLALIASLTSAQPFSMKEVEALSLVKVVEGLQGPTTGLDIVSQGSVTFVVDKNLTPIDEDDLDMEDSQLRGSSALYGIFKDEGVLEPIWIAKSFSDDEQFYTFKGKDVFFQTIVRAYAEHRPLVLSPDMVWLLISQGFARYVNAHSDELRDQIVSHTEKMDLVVETKKNLLYEDAYRNL